MRVLLPLLLLSLVADAQPPAVRDFRRLRKLRDDIASQYAHLKDQEEFALKPREEKMLTAFEKGEKFEGKALSGPKVIEILLKWEQLLQAEPTEAGKRVLEKLPDVLFKRYAQAIETPKDRKEVSLKLCDALDSDLLHIRACAFDALKKMYRTTAGFLYVETMSKKDRKEPIAAWRKHINKQK